MGIFPWMCTIGCNVHDADAKRVGRGTVLGTIPQHEFKLYCNSTGWEWWLCKNCPY